MSFTIKCPQCDVSLKASRSPVPGKLIQCLKCAHWFTPLEAGIQAAKPLPVIPTQTPTTKPNHRSALGLWVGAGVAAILFMGIGATGTYLFFRPAAETVAAVQETRVSEVSVDEPKVEKSKEPTEDKKVADFKSLMSGAKFAAQLKSYEEAVAGYAEALKLFPDAADAKKNLAESKTALDAVVKSRKDQQLAETESAALLKKGDEALGRSDFAAASEFYKQALAKTPASQEAVNKMVAVQGRVVRAAPAGEDEKKKLEDFDKHILAGKAALKANKTVEAIQEITAAARILPDDPLPPELLKEAEKQIAQAKNDNNKKDDLQQMLTQASGLKNLKKWDEAKAAYEQVLRLAPGDPTAIKGLQDVAAGLQATQSDVDRQLKGAYDNLIAGRIDQAIQQYRDIARNYPSNASAQQALQAAELVLRNRNLYYQTLGLASQSMQSLRFGDAIQFYSTILQSVPGDSYVLGLLREAQRLLDLQMRAKREYDAIINQSIGQMRAQRYTEAARGFTMALQMSKPPLTVDPALVNMIRYSEAMAAGDAALKSGRWADAVNFFTQALNANPNDPMAMVGLTRARTAVAGQNKKK